MPWQPPSLKVRWGSYFRPDPEDQQKVVALVQEALGGAAGTPLITLRAAVEKIAPIFEIENVDAALEALEKEREENEKRALEKTEQEFEAAHKAAEKLAGGAKQGPGGAGGGGKPPQAPGGGGRVPGAAAPRPR